MEERLWVEKYRPSKLEELEYNTKLVKMLDRLVKADDFPHILLYGPSGAGKRTVAKCILNELYGPQVHKIKSE
jgi:replication factor C subunit 3/5